MPQMGSDTKQNRIELVYHLLERHPNGLTEREIAEMLNFNPRAVNNYLHALKAEARVDKQGRLWLPMRDRRARLRRIDLSPEETATLYLAIRLLVKQYDKRNESAEMALNKLTEALTGDLGVGREIHQAALELAQRPGDESYSRVFRTIIQGYIYRCKVRITYHPLQSESFETVFSPYLLEPSIIGYATYAIGHSSIVDDLRMYKLQRIEQATLTRDEYAVPPDFPGLDVLRNAWSVIAGDEVIPIKLRFSADVTRRVKETNWHPSQDFLDDPHDPEGCIWMAQIASLTDFLPWVRGWGADVEVLEPPELRKELVREARQLATLYQVAGDSKTPAHFLLWGKADKKINDIHLLAYHMVDVGQTALALWQMGLQANIRHQLAGWLGLNIDETGRFISFLASLHDLGKASPAFQDHKRLRDSVKNRILSLFFAP